MIEFKPNKLKLSALQYVQCYEKMLLIRRFEEKCGQFYGMGLIGGFCHLYIGQEAVIMGFEFAKQKGANESESLFIPPRKKLKISSK